MSRKLKVDGPCHYCGSEAGTVDHIVPRALGGPNTRANVVASCEPCNRDKGCEMPTCACDKCVTATARWGRLVVRAGRLTHRIDIDLSRLATLT